MMGAVIQAQLTEERQLPYEEKGEERSRPPVRDFVDGTFITRHKRLLLRCDANDSEVSISLILVIVYV